MTDSQTSTKDQVEGDVSELLNRVELMKNNNSNVFFIDVSENMFDSKFKLKYNNGMGESPSQNPTFIRIEAIKLLILRFLKFKKLLFSGHKFSIYTFNNTMFYKVLDLTEDYYKVEDSLNRIRNENQMGNLLELEQLNFIQCYNEAMLEQLNTLDPNSVAVLRGIVIYGQSETVPNVTSPETKDIGLEVPIYTDVLFLHDPTDPNSNSQDIYDTLTKLENPKYPSYFFEVTTQLVKLDKAFKHLLAHPLHRPHQSSLDKITIQF